MEKKKRTRKTGKIEKGKGIVISYSNELNNFPLPREYTKSQYDLFWIIIGKIKDQGTNEVTVTTDELKAYIGYKGAKKRFNATIDGLMTNLMSTILSKETQNGETIKRTLFDVAKYDPKAETLTIAVKKESLDFFNNLTGNFTSWYQTSLLDLDTIYAKNLFRSLSQFANTGNYIKRFRDFRTLMGIPKSYENKEVRKRVVQPSVLRLAPYFKNLSYEIVYNRNNEYDKIEFHFEKFNLNSAVTKDKDEQQGIANIRLNSFLTDKEKWDAEDIFLHEKKGSAKEKAMLREQNGLGALDDLILNPTNLSVEDNKKTPVQESEVPRSQAPVMPEELEAVKLEMPKGDKKALRELLQECMYATLPDPVTIYTGNLVDSEGDPFVLNWIGTKFGKAAISSYEEVARKSDIINMMNATDEGKLRLTKDLLLGNEWGEANPVYIPRDPVLRKIWGDLTISDASLLAESYKNWQNNGARLSKIQQHDEALLKALVSKIADFRNYFLNLEEVDLRDIADLNDWARSENWNFQYDFNVNVQNVLCLNLVKIPLNYWEKMKPEDSNFLGK